MQKFTGFKWNGRRERAAMMVADDSLSDEKIAAEVGITRTGLLKWKAHPDFQERVRDIQQQMRVAVVARGIAERQNRVDALNRRWNLMWQLIDARAEQFKDIPGGGTGLLIEQYKMVGQGRDAQLVREYSTDIGLLREMRAHEQQAAQELGQWAEKRELTGKGGGSIVFEIARRESASVDDADTD